LIAMFAQDITVFLIGRALQGFAVGACQVCARALLVDNVKGERFFVAVVYLSLAWGLGPVIAPFVGGLVEQYAGWRWNFALYAALLQDAPLDALDVEMMKPQAQVMDIIAKAHARGVAVVLSNHDFTATPAHEVIIQRLRRQQAMGADVLKLAAMPTCAKDVLTLMAATQEMHALYAERPLLTMSMGPLGVTSRLAGQLTGGALTYASVGAPSAPGQLDAEAVRQVLGIIDRGANG
ncbi:type I 3-dehydroquinate dehydratase, partial [Pseudomonas sp.]|uniref:type I 3-dehydroquinate dehydratase n=1 Tax=Pseudomonas sp. TaxID=306 RepID=UPI00259071C7